MCKKSSSIHITAEIDLDLLVFILWGCEVIISCLVNQNEWNTGTFTVWNVFVEYWRSTASLDNNWLCVWTYNCDKSTFWNSQLMLRAFWLESDHSITEVSDWHFSYSSYWLINLLWFRHLEKPLSWTFRQNCFIKNVFMGYQSVTFSSDKCHFGAELFNQYLHKYYSSIGLQHVFK